MRCLPGELAGMNLSVRWTRALIVRSGADAAREGHVEPSRIVRIKPARKYRDPFEHPCACRRARQAAAYVNRKHPTMASKEECDRYAAQVVQRYEEFTKWAIANWPRKDVPLIPSDFEQSRKELSEILGPQLGEGDATPPRPQGSPGGGPFRDVTPMPWP